MVQTQSNYAKLAIPLFSLLLLGLVTNSGSFMQKGFAASDTHIVAAGDWHCTADAQQAVSLVKNLNPQLVLGLGDYSGEKTTDCWVNLVKPVASITKIAIGNHDDDYDGLSDSYLQHYGLSKQFYSYDEKNVHVLTMATEVDLKVGSEQYNFVVNDLRSAANNPDIKWIVATMHSPTYTSPNECTAKDCDGNKELRDIYHPLFDKYGVDLVLEAHVRNYQRSYPLEYNQQSPSNPIITSTNKGEYNNPTGVIFTIVGTGGGELKHGLKGQAEFVAYQQDTKFGILDMHFMENKLDAKFVAIDGSTMDHFSLSKTAKKKVIERISDDTFSDTNIRTVSDTGQTSAKPLAGQELQDGKPSITFKLDEEAASNTNAKPLAQDGKPSITFKLDEEGTDSTSKVNPLALQDGKPSITFKLDEEGTGSTSTKAKPLAGQEVQEVKPAKTVKLDSNDDNPSTDDKPKSSSERKVNSEDMDKSASLESSDNADKSHTINLLGTTERNNQMSNEISDSQGHTINTNLGDPFASLH